jgi:hypothetical protein
MVARSHANAETQIIMSLDTTTMTDISLWPHRIHMAAIFFSVSDCMLLDVSAYQFWCDGTRSIKYGHGE